MKQWNYCNLKKALEKKWNTTCQLVPKSWGFSGYESITLCLPGTCPESHTTLTPGKAISPPPGSSPASANYIGLILFHLLHNTYYGSCVRWYAGSVGACGIADRTDRRTGTGQSGTVLDIDWKEQRLVTKESQAEAPRRRLSSPRLVPSSRYAFCQELSPELAHGGGPCTCFRGIRWSVPVSVSAPHVG